MASISDRYITGFKLQINSHCPAMVLVYERCVKSLFSCGEGLGFFQ